MKLGRIAAALAVLAALALAAAATVRHYLHPEQLAAELAGKFRQSTGRELLIGGAIELRLFPQPAIVLGDLRFGNAAWGSQPWMATVVRAEAEMPWRALLRGKIGIARIHLSGAALLLETDAAGNGNWVMGAPDSGPADLSWLTGFAVDQLRIEPFTVAYRDGATGDTTRVALETVTLEAPAAPQPIRFRTHGKFSGTELEAQGSIGSLATLLAGDRPYPFTLSATSGTSRLEVSGEAGQPLQLAGLRLDVSAQGAALGDLQVLFPRTLGPWLGERTRERHDLLGLAYRLGWHVSGNWDAIKLSGGDVVVGDPERMEFRARGGMELRQTGSQPLQVSAMDLELQTRGREIKELLALAGESIPPAGNYAMSARLTGSWDAPGLSGIEIEAGSPERFHLTARGAVAKLRGSEGLDLRIAAVAKRPWRPSEDASAPLLPPFRLHTRVRDQPTGYALDDLELEVAGSRVDATVVASRREQRLHIAARAVTPLIDLAQVVASTDAAVRSATAPAGNGGGAGGKSMLHLANVDLDLQVGKLLLRDGLALTGISGRFALTREGLAITAGRLNAGGARVRLDGSIADPARGSGIDLALGIQGDELAELLRFAGKPIPAVGPYRATARVLGSLETLHLEAIDAQAGKPGSQARARGRIADAIKGEGPELALTADISDPALLSRLAGRDLPRLAPVKLSANFSRPQGTFAFDDLRLALGRTRVQGRLAVQPAEPRPRITASLAGPLLDLSELRPPRAGGKAPPVEKDSDPLMIADVDAEIRLDRLVLPDKRPLGPVSGRILLSAGSAELRQLAVSVDGAGVVVDGTVANPLEPAGLDLAVTADVQRTAALAGLAGAELPDLPPFKASGRLTDAQRGYAVSGLKLAFAATAVSGDLAVTRAAPRPKLRATLASSLFDVSEFLPEAPETAASYPADARVFSDTPLPFAHLRLADAELDLKVEKLRLRGGQQLGPIVARGTLADGRASAELLQIGVHEGGFLDVTGTVDASSGRSARIALHVGGKSLDLGKLRDRMGHPGEVTGGTTDLNLELIGRGNSLRSLAASLNGSAWIKVGPARLHRVSLDLGTGVIERVFGLLNPFRKTDPDTDLKCLAVNVPIAAGVIKSDRGIAVETAKFNAVASGTVNLATEAIAMGVTPIVNKGFSLGTDQMVQMVRIGGTIANPDIGVSAGGAARAVASLGADVATAGGWLLVDALIKKASADPRTCAAALGEPR